jgi:hypothetical protein
MKCNRIIWGAAFALSLLFGSLKTGEAARSAGAKIQVVYRAQPNGEWQVFIFGLGPCARRQNLETIWPADSATQPVEVECDNKVGGLQ